MANGRLPCLLTLTPVSLMTQWYYKRGYPSIPATFRSPTPVIAFQTVLIPGAFLSGFLLSPLLVISRHIASKPSHRLKVRDTFPHGLRPS